MKKSQAALEFLTTYAWAIISILIVLGALYYFWDSDFASRQSHVCEMGDQLECLDLGTNIQYGNMQVRNNFPSEVVLSKWGCKALSWSANNSWGVFGGQDTYTLAAGETDAVYIPIQTCYNRILENGERIDMRFGLEYYFNSSPSKTRHWLWGRISSNAIDIDLGGGGG